MVYLAPDVEEGRVSGYDLYGEHRQCDPYVSGVICPSGVKIEDMSSREFSRICEREGFSSVRCYCSSDYLCSGKMDILGRGYDYTGKWVEHIKQDLMLSCEDGGIFYPRNSELKQKKFRLACEAEGVGVVTVGCYYKRYLCPKKL